MSKTLSKGSITLITIGIVILILIGGTLTTYNGLVSKDEAASTAWSNLQAQYQRRADLVPNLVNTVKGYAKHAPAKSCRHRATSPPRSANSWPYLKATPN